jgi:hypothetical protein
MLEKVTSKYFKSTVTQEDRVTDFLKMQAKILTKEDKFGMNNLIFLRDSH